MIRQTITCDTCGIERKQANHWFEAFEHEGELRIRGLLPTKTTRPGLKHLCGQTCLHRLVDDFLAGNLASRMFGTNEETKAATDFAKLAASAQLPPELPDLLDFESSARLIETPLPQPSSRPSAGPRPAIQETTAAPAQAVKPAQQAFAKKRQLAKVKPPAHTRIAAVPPRPAPSPEVNGDSARTVPALAPSAAKSPLPQSLPVRAVSSAPFAASSGSMPETVRLSSSAPAGPFREPAAPLTPQARRAQAWERARAREGVSLDSESRAGGIRKFI